MPIALSKEATQASTAPISDDLKKIDLKLTEIEALRSLAALMIIVYHLALLPKLRMPDYLSSVIKHLGLGVPLFYALSGFVLALGYLGKLENGTQVKKFYIRRYFRIAPLFYVAMLVWIIASKLKWNTFVASYHDVVINALLLFGLVPGKHESIVWAGWSVGVEILFYVLFPIVSMMVRSIRSGILALGIAILVSSSFYGAMETANTGSYGYMNIITHLPTFLAGILAYLLWQRFEFARNVRRGATLFALVVAASLAVICFPSVYGILASAEGVRLDLYVWSLIFMALILSLCFWPNRLLVNKATAGLGRISFSMYLWHPLIIVLLTDVYAEFGKAFSEGIWSFLFCFGVTMPLVWLVAYLSYRFIELPGMRYGKRLANEC